MIDFKKIIENQNINDFDDSSQVEIIGKLLDSSIDESDSKKLEVAFEIIDKINLDKYSKANITNLYYNMSNGYSYKRMLKSNEQNSSWAFLLNEYSSEILYLRKTISSEGFNEVPDERKSQVYTNLGNNFSFIGRFVEAQECWGKAQEIIPFFPMAVGNMGFGLYHYGALLIDEYDRAIFWKFSHRLMRQALAFPEYMEGQAQSGFEDLVKLIESSLTSEFLEAPLLLNDFNLGEDLKLKKYRKWVLEKRLYLNSFNDIGSFTNACQDTIVLGPLKISIKSPPNEISLFNQIKQEYCSARYSFYIYDSNLDKHYSDKDLVLLNTLESFNYSYHFEQLKNAFRVSYSVLDKIAYFLNLYLNLEIPLNRVNFKNLWYSKDRELRPFFVDSKNWALRGLFWLSKDIYDRDEEFQTVLDPEAKELAKVRNFIEHKQLNIKSDLLIEFDLYCSENDFAYTIGVEDLKNKTLKTLKLVRAAILYLVHSVNFEESKKDHLAKDAVRIELMRKK